MRGRPVPRRARRGQRASARRGRRRRRRRPSPSRGASNNVERCSKRRRRFFSQTLRFRLRFFPVSRTLGRSRRPRARPRAPCARRQTPNRWARRRPNTHAPPPARGVARRVSQARRGPPRRHRARTARGASPALSRGLSFRTCSFVFVRSCSFRRRAPVDRSRRPPRPARRRALFAAPSRGRGAPRPGALGDAAHATTRRGFSVVVFGQNGNAWPTAPHPTCLSAFVSISFADGASRPSPLRLRLQLDERRDRRARPAGDAHGLAIFEPEAVRQRRRDLASTPVATAHRARHAANGAPPRNAGSVRLPQTRGAAHRAPAEGAAVRSAVTRERVGDGARHMDSTSGRSRTE